MEIRYAYIFTLGCRLNHADTALMTARLERAGYTVVDREDLPLSLIVINSCAVTAEAQRKSRQMVRHFRTSHPGAEIAVAGCAAELDHGELHRDGADHVLTNPGKRSVARWEALPRSRELGTENFTEGVSSRFPFRSRAFIKIQEGCDNFCSYCIVPTVRGPARSRNFEDALADCRSAVEAGFPEIVLTGVNTCAYQDGGRKLADLVHAVAALPGAFRIRLSSTEPHRNEEELLTLFSSEPRLCRFLHLSLQHGSDRILKAMNRHYRAVEFAGFVERLRSKVPGIHIGTDVIVGFPGETEEDFRTCCAFVEQMAFANLHLFIYSPRPGTAAAELPGRVPAALARERMEVLRRIGEASAARFAESQRGAMLPVLFERCENGILRGWSDNYLEVRMPGSSELLHRITTVPYRP